MITQTPQATPKPSDFIHAGWTRNKHAVDSRGRKCSPTAPQACRWDLIGAISAARHQGWQAPDNLIDTLRGELRGEHTERGLSCWNDEQNSPTRVLALLEGLGL